MPVDVGSDVAKAGKVNLVRVDQVPQRRFDAENDAHHRLPVSHRKIGHFTFVAVEDDAAKPRVVAVVNQNYATQRAIPDRCAARRGA